MSTESNAGGPGSVPGQGSHIPQLRVRVPQLKKNPACHGEDPRSCVLQLRPGAAKYNVKKLKKKKKKKKMATVPKTQAAQGSPLGSVTRQLRGGGFPCTPPLPPLAPLRP